MPERKPKKPVGLKAPKNKPLWHLFPFDAAEEVLKVIEYGANKYAPNNWKQNIIEHEDYYKDAMARHLIAFLKGEWLDNESGLPHIAHLTCNGLFMIWKVQNVQGISQGEGETFRRRTNSRRRKTQA